MSLENFSQNGTYFAPVDFRGSENGDNESTCSSADGKGISVNVTEGPIGFGVTAVLPGIEEDDITLQAESGNVISISAERIIKRTVQKQGKNRMYSSTEESSEHLRRSLKLPASADLDRVNTSFEDGVLTLLIAKREGANGRVDPGPVVMLK